VVLRCVILEKEVVILAVALSVESVDLVFVDLEVDEAEFDERLTEGDRTNWLIRWSCIALLGDIVL